MSPVAFVVVGHVDHGKSTLIGRLLVDTESLQDGRLEKVRQICREQRKPFEYAFLLDALEAEQLQGVTIDITEVRFRWRERQYLIIDAPGHKEFRKNMLSGAAHADAALLVIDAGQGVQEQSRRHAAALRFLGIKEIAIIISKMDVVDYSEEVFHAIRVEYERFLASIDVQAKGFIPVSAADGENITCPSSQMGWYRGPSVVEFLESLCSVDGVTSRALRLPVQDVYKFDERRIIVCRVESGHVSVGAEVQVWPSKQRAVIRSIEHWPETADVATCADVKEAVGFTLDQQLFVQRGDVITDPAHAPRVANFLAASVFWLGRAPVRASGRYKLKLATLERDIEVFSIRRVMDSGSMEVRTGEVGIGQNEVGDVVLKSSRPFVFDIASEIPATGRFVLLEGYDIVGGGIVLEAEDLYRRSYAEGLPKSTSISPVHEAVTPADQAAAYGHRGHVIWLTGVPGSGKSTIARSLERGLFSRDIKAFIVDGEKLRFGLSADLGFTELERREQGRRAAEVALLFAQAGLVAIVALVSPFNADREYARTLIGEEHFTLVYLHAPLAVLRERDPHDLYVRAAADYPIPVPGLTAIYESPEGVCLRFDTSVESIEHVSHAILDRVLAIIR